MATTAVQVSNIYNPANMSPQELIDNFVVRTNEFRRLFEALKSAPMERPEQHFIVVGPRGSGKSTLLQRLYYEVRNDPELSRRAVPVLFPEEQYGIGSLSSLWENVLAELDHEPEFAGVYDAFEANLSGSSVREVAFESLVKALRTHGKKVILFLENIGDLLDKFTEREHQRFREQLLTYAEVRIVGGSAVVLEPTYRYDQPLFDFFQFEYLRELNKEEVYALLTNLARSHKQEHVTRILQEHPERVETLRRLTGGIPRTIVLLFEIFADEDQGDSFKDLELVLDRVTPLYKHRMDGLTARRQRIMDCLAKNWDAMTIPEISAGLRIDQIDRSEAASVSTDVEELSKNSLIQRVPEAAPVPLYEIAERFFNIWYLMRFGRRSDKNRVLWFVRFLEGWCSEQDLDTRARKHLELLEKPNLDPHYALNLTTAFASTRLDTELQHRLVEKTRVVLSASDRSLLEDLPASDKELFESAVIAYNADHFDRAIATLRKIQNPSALTLTLLVKAYLRQNDATRGEHFILEALKVDPGSAHALGGFAYLQHMHRNYDQAEDHYRRAIDADPHNANNLNNYANFLVEQRRDYDEAEDYYRRAIEADPRHADNLGNYAIFLETVRRDYDRVERFYIDAVENGSENALSRLVNMYFAQHFHRVKALEFSKRQVETSSEPRHHYLHAKILLWNRRVHDSVAVARSAFEADTAPWIVTEARDYLLLLVAAEGYDEAWSLFSEPKMKLRERYRPVYYALLYFVRDKHPQAYRRMGGELKETVEELVARINEWRQTYFTERVQDGLTE